MLDLDRLVLTPLMGVFGQPIVVTPLASQPGVAPYPARGVFKIENIDMPLENGGILSTQVLTISVRKADFLVFVVPGDQVDIAGVSYAVDDTDDDAQGGSVVTLKRLVDE